MDTSRGTGRSGYRGFTSFTDWVIEQRDRPDGVGAFARAAAEDPHWPRRRATLLAFVSYLHERDGADFSRKALDAARREYEAASDASEFNYPTPRCS